MKSIRHTILASLAKEPMIMDGLVDATDMPKRRLSDNLTGAIKDGLVSRSKDDVTGMLLYTITAAGKTRLAEGVKSKGGEAMQKKPAKIVLEYVAPIQKKAASKYPLPAFVEDVDAVPADDSDTRIDVIGSNGNDGLHYDECDASAGETVQEEDAMPPADASLLASANRMMRDRLAGVAHELRMSGQESLANIDDGENLQPHVRALAIDYMIGQSQIEAWERMAKGVAHALRGSGLPALANIEDGEDLQSHVAALTGAYQIILAGRNDLQSSLDKQRILLASKKEEIETLKGDVEVLQRESIKGVTCISRPKERVFQGFACMVGGAEIYPDEVSARMAAESALIDFPAGKSVAVVAIVAQAENVLAPLWKEAA